MMEIYSSVQLMNECKHVILGIGGGGGGGNAAGE